MTGRRDDIELSVFKTNSNTNYSDINEFHDEIEFITLDKTNLSFTDRIKSITKISNQNLLLVTTIFFAVFVICEVIGGLAAHSLSLLGDAGAMTIDVCSYGFNFLAEYMKSKEVSGGKSSTVCHSFVIEVIIPGISVISLLAVTAWVCSDAVMRLLGHKEENVDVTFLYYFAVANLVVDVVCTWLFYLRRQDVFLQPAKVDQNTKELPPEHSFCDMDDVEIVFAEYCESDRSLSNASTGEDMEKSKNLNMISAFTHVGGDTLRSFTVLLAAVVSSTFNIDATMTDAVAAIVVSVTIVIAVIPLVYSLVMSILDYKSKLFSGWMEENYRGLNTESDDSGHDTHENDCTRLNCSESRMLKVDSGQRNRLDDENGSNTMQEEEDGTEDEVKL